MKPSTKAARPPHQACTDEYAYHGGGGYGQVPTKRLEVQGERLPDNASTPKRATMAVIAISVRLITTICANESAATLRTGKNSCHRNPVPAVVG